MLTTTHSHAWVDEAPVAVTVCDKDGIIIEMNEKAKQTFGKDRDYVGTNVLDCHPEPARTRLAELLATGRTNAYTIEKAGKKKLIYQMPWFDGGEFAGLVELSMEIPVTMPHFVRQQ